MSEAPAYQRIFAELKRRKVFRVAAAYGAAAFVVIQAADVIFPAIPLPEWTISFVVWLAILGFPFALVFAWVFERTPEGLQRTPEADESEIAAIVAEPPARRWPSGLAAVAGVALLVAGVWLAWRVATPDVETVTIEDTRLAVFPFGVVGSEGLDWLREGMPTLLSQNLFEPGEVETLDPVLVMNATKHAEGLPIDMRTAETVARDLGAGRFIVGTVQGTGGRVRMNAGLYSLRDSIQSLARAEVEGDTTELFALVDRLTAELLAERTSGEFGAASTDLVRTAAITTESLPALKAYLEGEEQLRKGNLDEAREAFTRAVEDDSTFALAMYRNAFALQVGLGDYAGEAAEWAHRAGRHADHLAEFDRRSLAAFTDHLDGRIRDAERAYRDLVSDYPSRLDARVLLTLLLAQYDPLRGRPLDEVMELLAQIDEADAEYFCMQCVTQRVTITREDAPAMAENWLRAAEADADSARRDSNLPLAQSVYALAHGDTAEFSRARRELLPQVDAEHAPVFALPWTATMIGQTALADTLARVDLAALEYPEDEYEGVLLFMDNVRGRWSDAGERVGRSFDLDPDATLLNWVSGWALNVPLEARVNGLEAARARCLAWDGQVSRWDDAAWQVLAPHVRLLGAALMSLQAEDSPRALALADSIETLPTDSTYLPAVRNAVRLVRGEAALRDGEYAAAVAILDELEWEMSPSAALANFDLGVARAQLVLAEAAWRSGDEATSRRWLEDGLTSWQVDDFALREMRRGQVSEELGDHEQARIHYARVVEALEPADDELVPRRKEAQARLVALMEGEG